MIIMKEGQTVSDKKHSDILPGVGCDVTNCKYNTVDCRCSAQCISVQNEKASSKGETYCATFCARGTN